MGERQAEEGLKKRDGIMKLHRGNALLSTCMWMKIGVTECAGAITENHVRFEVFTAVTMKIAVFWDVTPCGSCKKRRFGGT
jgi:hypothetical protein